MALTQAIINGDSYDLDDLPISFEAYNFQSFIHSDGYQYISLNKNDLSSDGNPVVVKVNPTTLGYELIQIRDDTADMNYHNTSGIVSLGERIFVTYPSLGNNTAIYKARADNSISGFDMVARIGSAGSYNNHQYPTLYETYDGKLKCFVREGFTDIIVFSSNDGETWDGGTVEFHGAPSAEADSDTPAWYWAQPHYGRRGNWHILSHYKRVSPTVGDSDTVMVKLYVYKTQDFATWYNLAETANDDSPNEAWLDANAMIWETDDYTWLTTRYHPHAMYIDPDGYPVLVYDTDYTEVYVQYWNGSAYASVLFDASGSVPKSLFWKGSDLYYFQGLTLKKTSNWFSTTETIDSFTDPDNNTKMKPPVNLNLFSSGQDFVIAGSGYKDSVFAPTSNTRKNNLQLIKYTL